MNNESFRRWCIREIGRVERGDVTPGDAIKTATHKAAVAGLPDLVRQGGQFAADTVASVEALAFLASCIAACVAGKPSEALTVAEGAVEAGVGLRTMYALCERGEVDHYRVGAGRGTIRINKNALAALQRKGVKEKSPRTTLEHLQAI